METLCPSYHAVCSAGSCHALGHFPWLLPVAPKSEKGAVRRGESWSCCRGRLRGAAQHDHAVTLNSEAFNPLKNLSLTSSQMHPVPVMHVAFTFRETGCFSCAGVVLFYCSLMAWKNVSVSCFVLSTDMRRGELETRSSLGAWGFYHSVYRGLVVFCFVFITVGALAQSLLLGEVVVHQLRPLSVEVPLTSKKPPSLRQRHRLVDELGCNKYKASGIPFYRYQMRSIKKTARGEAGCVGFFSHDCCFRLASVASLFQGLQ